MQTVSFPRHPKPLLPIVAGPTASGKTACAVELALLLNGEVVSADSMQIYRGMDILSAMPTAEEMRQVRHHMLGIADPGEKFSAAAYRERALEAIFRILSAQKQPIVCGGTGLYINALTRPMGFAERGARPSAPSLPKLPNLRMVAPNCIICFERSIRTVRTACIPTTCAGSCVPWRSIGSPDERRPSKMPLTGREKALFEKCSLCWIGQGKSSMKESIAASKKCSLQGL